jgi:hypothetical protein
MTKQKEPDAKTTPSEALPIVSMVLGISSLLGPGFLLGIPAIITAIIALKKDMGNRGLSITGLVTGIISTLFSLLIIAFVIVAVVWSLGGPDNFEQSTPADPVFDSMRT